MANMRSGTRSVDVGVARQSDRSNARREEVGRTRTNPSPSDASQSHASASGEVPSSTPLFTPLVPPKITSTSHAALVQWRKDRRNYEETARSRAKDGANDVIVPVKATFDQGLLRLWCRLRWHISMDEVTDGHIMAEVDKIFASVKNNNVPDIDYEMRSKLHMDLKETDVSERVIRYFKTCHDIIDDNGWRVFFDDNTGKKELYRILVVSLEPQALREDVERSIRFQARKAKEDEVVLHDLILEKALEHEKVFQRHRREKRELANAR
ncbi:hypothetical protein PPTG_13712 [Phytophthora nicotianae INRA-310]|uniref:Uncharacterized protein n=1 Tax=Phytophthora nicotianae (strain INRA-310) TaxID=761204 RepID=W2PZT3_PHYN3|nr:hypothetical protein PPTG_13712 [Phytophthora nicotianae INRA-310]ETN06367.1 hypothetical protein PPTG_13712 [Phytophthora nicotianae INRA-310]